MIYGNSDIHGISVHGIENLLSEFADDMGVYLKYDPLVLTSFTKTLERVDAHMGLKVSYDKMSIYRVGSLRNTNAMLYTTRNYVWSDGPIGTLGISINTDGMTPAVNIDTVMQMVQTTCSAWINCQMSLMEKWLL